MDCNKACGPSFNQTQREFRDLVEANGKKQLLLVAFIQPRGYFKIHSLG